MGRTPLVPNALRKGPFTVEDARREGIERWHLEGASWKRLGWGSYIWTGLQDTTLCRLIAALQRLPDGSAFSGMAALWLHGIDVLPWDTIEASVPLGAGVYSRSGMRIRRVELEPSDVVVVRGLPATTLVRTAADVCSTLSLIDAVVVADAALHSRRLRMQQLTAWAQSRRGGGDARLKRVIGLAEAATESPMETRLRLVLELGGLPRPKAQISIYDANGRFAGRPDLYYEEARLGIEFDGGVHRTSMVEDNRRQNNLLNAGVRLLRFTSADVLGNPGSVVQQVRVALTGSSSSAIGRLPSAAPPRSRQSKPPSARRPRC